MGNIADALPYPEDWARDPANPFAEIQRQLDADAAPAGTYFVKLGMETFAVNASSAERAERMVQEAAGDELATAIDVGAHPHYSDGTITRADAPADN